LARAGAGGHGLQPIQRVKLASACMPGLEYASAIGQPMCSPAVVSGATRAASPDPRTGRLLGGQRLYGGPVGPSRR